MADTVRYMMEEMIPELQDLETRGYFSKAELKEVARRRMDFEYLLKRRAALKADYLRYIAYETQLEELRLLRKEGMGLTGKKSLADHAMVRRCHFIYERGTRKFAGDLRLWLRWLQYCRQSDSARQTSRVLTKALQLHPNAAGLWSYAAAWEFEHNANAAAARALMQRGLRMAKRAPQLWVEYFRLELMYVHKLRARRRVLGLEDDAVPVPTAPALTVTEDDEEEGAPASEETKDAEARAAVEAVLRGQVAAVVYRSAVAARPDDVSFRATFLDALKPFSFPGVEEIEKAIYESIAKDFAGREEAWDIRARGSRSSGGDPMQAATAIYEEAVEKVPTTRMYDMYAAFLRERVDEASELAVIAGGPPDARARAAALTLALLRLYSRAAEAGAASEETLLAWPTLAARCGQTVGSAAAVERALELMPTSSPVRLQWLAAQSQRICFQLAQCSDEKLRRQLNAELEAAGLKAAAEGSMSLAAAAPVWLAALESCLAMQVPLGGLLDGMVTVLTGSAAGPMRGGMGVVAAAALGAVHVTEGIEAARKLVARLSRVPSPGGSFWLAAIGLESAEVDAAMGTPGGRAPEAGIKRAARLYEVAVDAHGADDWQLWLEYVQFVQRTGGKVGDLQWRAGKALKDPEPFRTALQQPSS